MRILLALITVFAVFQAQAYCYITGDNKTPLITPKPIEINLDTSNREIVNPLNFTSNAPDFNCYLTTNTFSLSTSTTNAKYYYAIKNSVHNIVVEVSLTGEKTTSSAFSGNLSTDGAAHAATILNNELTYKLKYNLLMNHTGTVTDTIEVNQPTTLQNTLLIKPNPCSACVMQHPNKDHKYIYEIPFYVKFTPTTCTFKNQEISAPDISYHEIDSNGFTAPRPKQPELQCSSITGVATSNIHYHFESISATQGDILKNDLETQQGGAGEIGFQLTNNNKAINFSSSEKFTLASRGSALLNNTVYPLNLQLRYARYSNKVFAGRVQSKVKVVVDYD